MPWLVQRDSIAELWHIPPYILPPTWEGLRASPFYDEVSRLFHMAEIKAFAERGRTLDIHAPSA